jgi:hypothetical protein
VEQLVDFSLGGAGGGALFGGEGAEGDHHGGIDVAGVEQKRPDDLLDEFGGGWEQWGCVVDGFRELDGDAVLLFGGRARGILGTRRFGVLELVDGGLYIAGHGNVQGVVGVIPAQGYATIQRAGPIFRAFVVRVDGQEEMFCMFVAFIFNAKIIVNERELDGVMGMVP